VADLTRRADGELEAIRNNATAELGAHASAAAASLAAAELAAQDQHVAHADATAAPVRWTLSLSEGIPVLI
jgi:hypothetical protein